MSRLFCRIHVYCLILALSFSTASIWAIDFTGNVLALSQTPGRIDYRISEIDSDGNVVQTLIPEEPPMSSDLWNPRDLVIDDAGDLHVFNGTFDPYLSTYNSSTATWSHRTHAGWSTINNGSYGGIGYFGNQVFVTNMSTSGQNSSGVVVFDLPNGTSSEFASTLQATDLNIGLDASLWVLSGSSAHQFDPTTFSSGNVVSMSAAGSDIRSIAVDADGNFYVATWEGFVAKLDSNGSLIDRINFGFSVHDIDVSEDGQVVVGSRLEGTWLTDTNLATPTQIESGRWQSFATFVPQPIPEPSTISILSVLIGSHALRRRRSR